MAPLTPWVPLLFALDQRLIVSSAALLTSLILVSRETLQARLLSVALSAATLPMVLVQAQSGGGGNPWLVSSMPPVVVPGPVDFASAPLSSDRSNYAKSSIVSQRLFESPGSPSLLWL